MLALFATFHNRSSLRRSRGRRWLFYIRSEEGQDVSRLVGATGHCPGVTGGGEVGFRWIVRISTVPCRGSARLTLWRQTSAKQTRRGYVFRRSNHWAPAHLDRRCFVPDRRDHRRSSPSLPAEISSQFSHIRFQ